MSYFCIHCHEDVQKTDDTACGWRHVKTGRAMCQLDAEPSNGRTPQDFAIEHAGYLVDAVERYFKLKNTFAEFVEISGLIDTALNTTITEQFQTDIGEAWTAVNNAIFEFRKRAARCKEDK